MAWFAVGAAVVSGVVAARSAQVQGQTQAKIAANNATVANYAAQDAQQRGELAAMQARRNADQVLGAQRARMAANGIDLGVGTAGELQAQADFFGEQDQRNARFNAAREAWSDRAQAANFNAQGAAAETQARGQEWGSILTGATGAASKWYTSTRPPPMYPYGGYGGGY